MTVIAGSGGAAENAADMGVAEARQPLPPSSIFAGHGVMEGHRGSTGLEDFRALAAGYRSAIYRAAYRLTGNQDDAEDLVQESLIEAFRAFGQFHIGTHFDRWVYRIMTRTYIDKFRRRKRIRAASLDDGPPEYDRAQLGDAAADPQEMLERNSLSEPVQSALDRLAPEFRAVVLLCDFEELSYEEASRILGCPVGTVRSRLHRARDQLREWLRPLLRQDGR